MLEQGTPPWERRGWSLGLGVWAGARKGAAGGLALAAAAGRRVAYRSARSCGGLGSEPAKVSPGLGLFVAGRRVAYLPGLAMHRIADLYAGQAKTGSRANAAGGTRDRAGGCRFGPDAHP